MPGFRLGFVVAVMEIPFQDSTDVSQEEAEDHQSTPRERDSGHPRQEIPRIHGETSLGEAVLRDSRLPSTKPTRLIGKLKNRLYSCHRLIETSPMENVQM